MAGIDYTIPGQFKGIQVESPMNMMAQAMQLRGLQESSQMNALKAQEYQRQVQERNALARLMSTPGLKYGSDEFFNRLAAEAPSEFERIATGEEKRQSANVQQQLARATQQQREAAEEEQRRKTRLASREFGLRKIAGAPDYGQAVSMIERSVRAGEIDREEADDMLSRLTPDADMSQFRTQTLTNMLEPEKALTAGADIEKATLGVDTEKQKLEKEKLALETAQLDTRLNQFNAAFPAFNIRSEQDVENRIRAMADDKVLGPLATRFGPLEDTIARNIAEYRRNPLDYVKRMSGVSGADILKAADERDNEAYRSYRLNEIYAGRQPLDKESFLKNRNVPQTTTPAPAAVSATATTSEAPAAVTTAADGTRVMPSVTVAGQTEGFDYLDPTAKRLLQLAAETKDSTEATALRETAGKIQAAFEKDLEEQRKGKRLTGDFLNVTIAEDQIAELEKNPNPVNLRKIANLRQQIKAANEGKAPKTNVNVSVSTEKKYGEKFAGNVADADIALRDAAERTPETAATANRILGLLSSGQIITGAGANVKLQLAKLLNLGGGNDNEAVTNTEVLMSSLAESTLGAIKSSGLGSGQGFTDKDREFLERAKSGQITYETSSLKRLAELSHKASVATAAKWNKRVKEIPKSAIEGTGINTNPVVVPSLYKSGGKNIAPTNAKGWQLHTDANGNSAYVSPDGTKFEEVK